MNPSAHGLVSVIMPVYNASRFLREAIDSILRQTDADFELIIVNDGSTDESEDIILSYKDPRIVYIKQDNAGVAAARNTALDIAKGEFILWQDADDVSMPRRLETMIEQFAAPEIGFVHSDMLLIDESDNPTGYWQSLNIEPDHMLRFFLKTGTPFNNGSMLMRREMFRGFKHDSSLRIGSDSDMVFHVTPGWKSVHIPEALYVYRRHSSSITKNYNYEELAAHIRKFLSRHSLEELVPELTWNASGNNENEAKACAIVALLLARRGMGPDANIWLENAVDKASEADAKLFVRAVALIANGNYELAQQVLISCQEQDYIIMNYIGEACAYLGDTQNAFRYFMKAAEMAPSYIEPVDNLNALGGSCGLQLVDMSWRKFKQAS